MYLSKLTLDPRQAQARRDLADAYEMHRTLVRAFAPDADTPPARFLWRLEGNGSDVAQAVVLVQASVPGNWTAIDAIPGYTSSIQGNKPVDLEKFIRPGNRYRFRLRANPTVTREGKRLGLAKEEEQLAWLARQGERHGFTLLACLRSASERIQVRQGRGGHRITMQSVVFNGLLEVRSEDDLCNAVAMGLGHGKALGLGLLSLAPVGAL